MSHTDLAIYRRLLREAWPYWPHIAGIFLFSLLSTPIALLVPLPMKIVVDSVLGSHPLPHFVDVLLPPAMHSKNALLAVMVALLVAIALVSQLKELGVSLLRTYTGEKLVLGFRTRLFCHVQRLSLFYHDSRGSADSTYRIQWDAQSIQYIMIDGLVPFLTSGCSLALMLYVTVRLDPQLAMVGVAISPVLLVLMRIYRRRLRGQARTVKELDSSAQSVVQEVLAGIRVVKAFGQEFREQERFVSQSSAGVRARLRLAFVENGFGLLVGLTTAGGTAVVVSIGAHHVLSGRLTLGELLMVMAYLSQLYEPLKTISKKSASLQSHLASAERAFALLDHPPDVSERPNGRRLVRATGAVAFRHVSFAYDGASRVLHDVSFDVAPGTCVGIAGATGAGEILLDGVDLRDYRLADLRDQFAIVLQDPVLFSTSVGENIAYGRPTASDEEIVAAAKAAGAHDFIVRSRQGYGSRVGERGMQLSGGERQRIALARAYLKNAPILIFDEPTSSVDLRTEAVILEALERLMRGRTTFLITHRASALTACDIRLQVERGRLVEATPSLRCQKR